MYHDIIFELVNLLKKMFLLTFVQSLIGSAKPGIASFCLV